MKNVSIIIVTFNSTKLIRDCLQSIIDNNDIGDSLNVIVADNASTDQKELFELIEKEFKGANIHYYSTGENAGYGKGNNFGIAKTDAEIVIVMNPDVRFISPVFKQIISEFEDKNLGMAGVDFIDGSCPYYFKPEYNTLFKSLFIHQYIKRRKYDPRTMYMSGSLLIFDRESFINVGGFDENIFMYYEEPDITNRILQAGKEVKWFKELRVLHLAHGRKFNQRLADISYDSLEYYCKKYKTDVRHIYSISLLVLKLKLIVAKAIRDKGRENVFSQSINSIKKLLESKY